jgi:hypothetical protein
MRRDEKRRDERRKSLEELTGAVPCCALLHTSTNLTTGDVAPI